MHKKDFTVKEPNLLEKDCLIEDFKEDFENLRKKNAQIYIDTLHLFQDFFYFINKHAGKDTPEDKALRTYMIYDIYPSLRPFLDIIKWSQENKYCGDDLCQTVYEIEEKYKSYIKKKRSENN